MKGARRPRRAGKFLNQSNRLDTDSSAAVRPIASRIVLRALSLNRLEDLVSWATDADKMAVARLAPVVFEAAKNGDSET